MGRGRTIASYVENFDRLIFGRGVLVLVLGLKRRSAKRSFFFSLCFKFLLKLSSGNNEFHQIEAIPFLMYLPYLEFTLSLRDKLGNVILDQHAYR